MLAQRIAMEQERVPTWTYVGKKKVRTGTKSRADLAREAYDRRSSLEQDWETALQEVSDRWFKDVDLDAMIRWYQTAWAIPATKRAWFRKDTPPQNPGDNATPPSEAEQMAQINAWLNSPEGLLLQQGVQVYLGQATHTSTLAGQTALDHMGLNRTFAWAHPRAMARDLFAVRGSKVIQQMYGSHMDKLQQIILRATNPRHPQTIDQVRKLIAQEWPKMQASDVTRIARTETASLWTHTSMNTYSANGITQFSSLLAEGPSIGIESEDPCDECIDAAATVFNIEDDPPPWHPNCRCEAIPILQDAEGDPWLPPDEPFTGEDVPMCESDVALARSRAGDLRKHLALRIGARLKKDAGIDGACLIPSPEPGATFGGDAYETLPPLTPAQLDAYLKDIFDWPDYASDVSQVEVKNLARNILSSNRRKKLARSVQSGKITGVSDFEDGMLFPGKPQTIYVRRMATQSGGARRILGQYARDAYKQKKWLAVDTSGISPQLKKTIEKWGFTPVEDGSDAYILSREKLREPFKITDEELPKDPYPVHEPLAPTPTDDLDTLTAKKKSAQNRLDGHRKKLKKLQEEPLKNAEQIAAFEEKVAAEQAEIADLNAKIAQTKLAPHAPIPAEVPDVPVAPPLETPPPLPEVPAPEEMHAAAYDSEVDAVPFEAVDLEKIDALREQSSTWMNEGWTIQGDTPGAYPTSILDNIEQADNMGMEGYGEGLLSLRAQDGELRGLASYSQTIYPDGQVTFGMSEVALAHADDMEGALRAATQGAKLAHDAGANEFAFAPNALLAHENMDALSAALTDRGFEVIGPKAWRLKLKGAEEQPWLKDEPAPLVPEQNLIEDDISVGAGEPLTQEELAKIKSKGLDGVPTKGAGAIKALKGADSTKQLYFDYEKEEWSKERVKDEWNAIEGAFFKDKVPELEGGGTPLYSVKYKNLHTGEEVTTIPQNLFDSQDFQSALGSKGIESEIVQVSGFKKTAYFTSGGGGAGKSGSKFLYRGKEMTLAELRTQPDVIYVNPDDIREMLPEYREMLDMKDTYAAAGTHAEASAIAALIRKKAFDQGYSVLVDGTAGSAKFMGKLAQAKAAGYELQVTMTSIDTNEAIARSLTRGDHSGRYVPIDTLKEAHAGASRMMDEWMKDPDVAHWRVYDNSGAKSAEGPRLVAIGGEQSTVETIHDPELLTRIKAKRYEAPVKEEEHGGLASAAESGGVQATPESLRIQLYGAQNRIAGHKKALKKALKDGNKENEAKFAALLKEDEQLRDDLKAALVQMGHKPVALKPGTALKPEIAPKPVAAPEPAPVEPTTGPQKTPAPATKPKPENKAPEPKLPEPAPPKAHEPDTRRVVPGGIAKEKGSTKLSAAITERRKRGDGAIKSKLVDEITERLKESPEFDSDAIRQVYGYSAAHYAESGDNAIVSQLIQNWAHSSSDADARGVAMQIAAKEEFGLDVRAFAADYWNDEERNKVIVAQAEKLLDGKGYFENGVFHETGKTTYRIRDKGSRNYNAYRDFDNMAAAEDFARMQERNGLGKWEITTHVGQADKPPVRAALRAFLRRQWENTQHFMDEQGIDEITVYRGRRTSADALGFGPGKVGYGPGLSTGTLTDNPIASWSIRHSTARGSFYGGTMLRASVPKEMVMGTCLSGFGCANEFEVIVMNAGDSSAWIAQEGRIEMTADRRAQLEVKLRDLQGLKDSVNRELQKIAPDEIPPTWGDPQRQRYNELLTERRTHEYAMQEVNRALEHGYEMWKYDKEADLKNYIHEAVAENPSLAGKAVKLPKKAAPMTAAEQELRPYKQKVTSVKRMISNRQKKIDTYKAAFDSKVVDLMGTAYSVNWDEALFYDWSQLQREIPDYRLRSYVSNAQRYARSVRTLHEKLAEAEAKLASKKQELGYTKAMRKLRRRLNLA